MVRDEESRASLGSAVVHSVGPHPFPSPAQRARAIVAVWGRGRWRKEGVGSHPKRKARNSPQIGCLVETDYCMNLEILRELVEFGVTDGAGAEMAELFAHGVPEGIGGGVFSGAFGVVSCKVAVLLFELLGVFT